MKRFIVLFLMCSLFTVQAFGKISFGVSDLNSQDEVLFTVKQDMAGINPYKSLFYSKIVNGQSSGSPSLLTCYPEQMELLENKTVLQIRNRYGSGRYYSNSGTYKCMESCSEIPLNSLPVTQYEVSPDGKYFCYIDKSSLGFGNLVLQDVSTGKTAILWDKARQSYDSVPVKWAPDSAVLIYEKENNLYFCKPEAVLRGIEMDEKYRSIGRGTINSINWVSQKYMIYIDDYQVYQINSKELYTLGLYSGILSQGKVIGRLAFQFDSLADKFSVNPNLTGIVLVKNQRLFSYLLFPQENNKFMDVIYSRPYLDSSASLVESYIFWDAKDNPVLWLQQLPYENCIEKASVYLLSDRADCVLETKDSGKPFISPDGKKVAFYENSALYVYDLTNWQELGILEDDKIVSVIWETDSVLYAGGEKTVRRWNLNKNSIEIVALSSAEAGYWDKDSNSVIAQLDEEIFYIYNKEKTTWTKVNVTKPEGNLQNENFRVFCGPAQNSKFENGLFIRSLKRSAVTKPMYKACNEKSSSSKKVALIFDAYDNGDGISKILSTLKKYNVPGTFFVNGEFIRRNPLETKQIASAGYSVGSMFFSQTDLVNNSFIVDEDFIRRGLARNEDEYYACTKKELGLFWHAPYFSVSPKIIKYGQNAGYDYVPSLHDINDSIYLDKNVSPELIIQKYCDSLRKTSGGIVPIAAGFSQGQRTDPLYNHLDLLICTLVDAGYEFVTVDSL